MILLSCLSYLSDYLLSSVFGMEGRHSPTELEEISFQNPFKVLLAEKCDAPICLT
jgi:hypothetical protein